MKRGKGGYRALGMMSGLFVGLLAAGCQNAPLPRAEMAAHVELDTVGGRSLEPCERWETFVLRYHGRGLELTVHHFGQVSLEEAPNLQKSGKRILLTELLVTLDLSAEQWRDVFAQWFTRINGLPAWTQSHGMPVIIGKRPMWRYTYLAAQKGERSGSRYWRVYLIPSGRKAYVVRSEQWAIQDGPRYNALMDTLAAHIELDK
ncbi:MAG TPA: hypothetical protein VFB21_08190 [Chthonomonadaceae bacterium]|nr:hypothetical protein [Chthonomonadaceae bacterium]